MADLSFKDQGQAQELLEAIQFFSQKNWSPATSTNYSIRLDAPGEILISRSGVDKSQFKATDLISIDGNGNVCYIRTQ
jgi:methylthioribulose-1-phosphate dehydratase